MKYLVKDLLEGSYLEDHRVAMQLADVYQEKVEQLKEFEHTARELTAEALDSALGVVDKWSENDFIYSDQFTSRGVNRHNHDRLVQNAQEARDKLDSHGESDLTLWLSTLQDDTVTDTDIAKAGFKCRPGYLVALAKKAR